jgi:hypothetical protein
MVENVNIKEIIFWLIFLGVVFFVGFWLINFAKESDTDSNNSIFTKTTTIPESDPLLGLEIKIPEHESVVVKLNKKQISANKERYMAEFNQKIFEGDMPLRGSVVLIDEIKFENSKYEVVPMATNFGGSGEFIYLILLEKTVNGLKHIESLPVGDRIVSESFEEVGSKIIFNYKSHHESQAMVEVPIVSTKLEFEIQNGKFVEGLKYFNTKLNDFVLENPKPNSFVDTLIDVNFQAKGWLFENSSLAKLITEDYRDLDSQSATSVDGDWMRTDLISIKVQLNAGEYKGKAKIILMADNPSGLKEKDKKVEFWVYIK